MTAKAQMATFIIKHVTSYYGSYCVNGEICNASSPKNYFQRLAVFECANPRRLGAKKTNYIHMSMHVNDVYSKVNRQPNASSNLGERCNN